MSSSSLHLWNHADQLTKTILDILGWNKSRCDQQIQELWARIAELQQEKQALQQQLEAWKHHHLAENVEPGSSSSSSQNREGEVLSEPPLSFLGNLSSFVADNPGEVSGEKKVSMTNVLSAAEEGKTITNPNSIYVLNIPTPLCLVHGNTALATVASDNRVWSLYPNRIEWKASSEEKHHVHSFALVVVDGCASQEGVLQKALQEKRTWKVVDGWSGVKALVTRNSSSQETKTLWETLKKKLESYSRVVKQFFAQGASSKPRILFLKGNVPWETHDDNVSEQNLTCMDEQDRPHFLRRVTSEGMLSVYYDKATLHPRSGSEVVTVRFPFVFVEAYLNKQTRADWEMFQSNATVSTFDSWDDLLRLFPSSQPSSPVPKKSQDNSSTVALSSSSSSSSNVVSFGSVSSSKEQIAPEGSELHTFSVYLLNVPIMDTYIDYLSTGMWNQKRFTVYPDRIEWTENNSTSVQRFAHVVVDRGLSGKNVFPVPNNQKWKVVDGWSGLWNLLAPPPPQTKEEAIRDARNTLDQKYKAVSQMSDISFLALPNVLYVQGNHWETHDDAFSKQHITCIDNQGRPHLLRYVHAEGILSILYNRVTFHPRNSFETDRSIPFAFVYVEAYQTEQTRNLFEKFEGGGKQTTKVSSWEDVFRLFPSSSSSSSVRDSRKSLSSSKDAIMNRYAEKARGFVDEEAKEYRRQQLAHPEQIRGSLVIYGKVASRIQPFSSYFLYDESDLFPATYWIHKNMIEVAYRDIREMIYRDVVYVEEEKDEKMFKTLDSFPLDRTQANITTNGWIGVMVLFPFVKNPLLKHNRSGPRNMEQISQKHEMNIRTHLFQFQKRLQTELSSSAVSRPIRILFVSSQLVSDNNPYLLKGNEIDPACIHGQYVRIYVHRFDDTLNTLYISFREIGMLGLFLPKVRTYDFVYVEGSNDPYAKDLYGWVISNQEEENQMLQIETVRSWEDVRRLYNL